MSGLPWPQTWTPCLTCCSWPSLLLWHLWSTTSGMRSLQAAKRNLVLTSSRCFPQKGCELVQNIVNPAWPSDPEMPHNMCNRIWNFESIWSSTAEGHLLELASQLSQRCLRVGKDELINIRLHLLFSCRMWLWQALSSSILHPHGEPPSSSIDWLSSDVLVSWTLYNKRWLQPLLAGKLVSAKLCKVLNSPSPETKDFHVLLSMQMSRQVDMFSILQTCMALYSPWISWNVYAGCY